MRVIIDCDPGLFDAALSRISAEMRGWERRYHKIGWGWTFKLGEEGERCFVRRTTLGLSLRQIRRPTVPGVIAKEAHPA